MEKGASAPAIDFGSPRNHLRHVRADVYLSGLDAAKEYDIYIFATKTHTILVYVRMMKEKGGAFVDC